MTLRDWSLLVIYKTVKWTTVALLLTVIFAVSGGLTWLALDLMREIVTWILT